MHTFTDTQGRVWTLAITVDAVKRVRALTGTDLLTVAGGDLLERLSTDPVLLADVLFAVVKPEADAKQVSDADFGRALAGDAIGAATQALLQDLVDFFPAPKRRLLAQALGKLTEVQDAVLAAASLRLAAVDAAALARQGLPGEAPDGDLVWHLAGIVGCDPGGLTLRELAAMAEARQREAWNHTAALLALLANCHRDPQRSAAFTITDFHPLSAPAGPPPRADITALRDVFVHRRFPETAP